MVSALHVCVPDARWVASEGACMAGKVCVCGLHGLVVMPLGCGACRRPGLVSVCVC